MNDATFPDGDRPERVTPEQAPTDPIAFAMYVQRRLDRGDELEDILAELDAADARDRRGAALTKLAGELRKAAGH